MANGSQRFPPFPLIRFQAAGRLLASDHPANHFPRYNFSEMVMVKQERDSNHCGLCVVAMLTDRSREELLAAFPHYEKMADWNWLNYIRSLGFRLQDPRDDEAFDRSRVCGGNVFAGHFKLPYGYRYYCTVWGSTPSPRRGTRNSH